MHDPVRELRSLLTSALGGDLRSDAPIATNVHWSPHVFDVQNNTAWHIMSEIPDGMRWFTRMQEAARTVHGLRLGLCAPLHVLYDETVLDLADQIDTRIASFDADAENPALIFIATIADMIYEHRLALSHKAAALVLDRWLTRCHAATDNHAKGITLEGLTAVMLSQVAGFEVKARGISNRSQQLDVQIHNRRTAGILGQSELVYAEAKNWRNPVGTTEYYSVYRKIETKFGRSRLGFFVTTDQFTRGVTTERLRDSKGNILVVPLDRDSLPAIWRTGTSVTANIEEAAIDAANV